MDKILQAFSEIAGYLPRLDRLKATFGDITDFEQMLGLIYSDIMEFHRRAYKFFRRKAWHIWFAFDWGLFERRFKSILDKLRSHCDLLDREAAAIHFSEMKIMRDKREVDQEDFEQCRRLEAAQQVFAWLAAVEDSQEERLHGISDDRQPGTCNWILEDQQIRSWIEDDNGETVVWMTGIPGAGKSFLCSLIIQNLETHQDLDAGYYFCGHQQSDKNTCATILRTLMVQLLRSHLDMAELVYRAYLLKGSSRSYPAIKRILKQILSTLPTTRILIDGLDECSHETQQETLKSLLEIQRYAGHNCKLLVSSREEPRIGRTLLRMIHLKLDGRTKEGLNIFIQNKIKELKIYFPDLEPILLSRVESRLQTNAKGMFLWVRLVCNMLQQQSSDFEIERTIEQLPDGLDEAYGLILDRFRDLSTPLRTRVFKILFWMSAAERSVSIHEIADGIALNPDQIILSKKTRSRDLQRDILEICAPLLEKSKNGKLNLVHFSAKEYLLHEQSGPFIDIARAHFNIAYSCIVNLTTTLVIVPRHRNNASLMDLESQIVQGNFGLQPYGHQFWAEHVLAFLDNSWEQDPQVDSILEALKAFSQVCKTQPSELIEASYGSISQPLPRGFNKLREHPSLFNFVLGQVRFKSKAQSIEPTIDGLRAQEDWRLQTDETYLSLIDAQIREITERLLATPASSLPPHISGTDYQAFVDRFSYGCRFFDCTYSFDSLGDRDSHEQTHARSFPCLQCDWGFRSRKDLEKHTQKYHMSAEDFEIPLCLYDTAKNSDTQNNTLLGQDLGSAGRPRNSCWNKHGREVLQKGFRQVLAKFDLETAPAGHVSAREVLIDEAYISETPNTETAPGAQHRFPAENLASIRAKVAKQQYETLTDFKEDLQGLYTAIKPTNLEEISVLCDQEFEKAISDFPAFANFDVAKPRSYCDATNPGNVMYSQRSTLEPSNDVEVDSLSQFASSMGKRGPYWSRTEKIEFPELLEQCGRNFIRIADRLKTKTLDDIDQYVARNPELLRLADDADVRRQQMSEANLPIVDEDDSEVEPLPSFESSTDATPVPLAYSAEAVEAMILSRQRQQDASAEGEIRSNMSSDKPVSQITTTKSEILGKSKSTRRLPRPRATCPNCNRNKNGLHDEYALERHFTRYHKPTRQVWTCEDISINKKFLARCKPCSTGKRYSSKHNASKHLRDHFGAEASDRTLARWMRELEEPNPRFDKSETLSAQANNDTHLSTSRQGNKRQKLNNTSALRGKTLLSNSADVLPPMLLTPKKQSPSSHDMSHPVTPGSHQGSDEPDDGDPSDLSTGEDSFLAQETLLLPDVSFGHFLPGPPMTSQYIDRMGPPHRRNLALIKPDQVQRLVHLNPYTKLATQDQVEALYRTLDNSIEGRMPYREALKDLTDLTQLLLRGLKEWRQRFGYP